MRHYETTFIVNPQADDATIDRQVKAVAELITTNGGRIVYEDRIGTRRLAFMIRGLNQGYYASLVFEGETAILPALDRLYKLEEAYIRNLTILFEGDPLTIKERKDAFASSFEERDDRGRRGDRDDDRGDRRYGRDRDRDRDRDDHYRGRRPYENTAPPSPQRSAPAPAPTPAPAPEPAPRPARPIETRNDSSSDGDEL